MEMTKMDIMGKLGEGVQHSMTPPAYAAIKRNLIEKQGVSEIALYAAVADHLEENDIDPDLYCKDAIELFQKCSKDIFILKTEDKFDYLRNSFSTISMEGSPESRGEFFCNKCFKVKKADEKSKKPNYKNACNDCAVKASRDSVKNAYQKKLQREKDLKESKEQAFTPADTADTAEAAEPKEPLVSLEMVRQIIAETQLEKLDCDPYIKLDTVTADPSGALVSISCDTRNLSKLLILLDPYQLPAEPKNEEEILETDEIATEADE